ncbi:hypothetical protein B0H12DRAFT_1106488 [Mycena haematopus]|nr:hypothetical protein B0H12DRAFT_1106488 [Mycena haematopus]
MSYPASNTSKSESGFFGGPSTLAQHAPLRSNFDDSTININVSALPPAATPQRRPPSRRSQRSQRAVPTPLKAAALLAAFLPLPPLISIIYLACGHGVLRAATTFATVCAALVLTLGCIAGALGTVCLPVGLMLSAAEAAAAGIVGAVVICSPLAALAGCAFLLWAYLRRPKSTTMDQR